MLAQKSELEPPSVCIWQHSRFHLTIFQKEEENVFVRQELEMLQVSVFDYTQLTR